MSELTRKAFLKQAGLLGLGALSGAALLQACSGDEKGASPTQPSPETAASKESTDSANALCEELNASLTDTDKATREAVAYESQSSDPEKNCANCRFWQPDKFDGPCGGCMLFPNGAVNPQGNCKSWAAPTEV